MTAPVARYRVSAPPFTPRFTEFIKASERSNLQALIEGHETQAARLCEGEPSKGA